MVEKYRVTRHNGRSGKNGVYNPKHNDRSFDISSVDHIDAEKKKHNGYWDCYQGYRTDERQNNGSRHFLSFEEVESRFYEETFSDFVNGQNARNIKNRHPERNRTTQDLLQDKRTCPEETIYQIGNIDGTVDPYELMMWVEEFFHYVQERFGDNVKFLDWSLHMDEGTPHIHERHVFVWKNEYGEICPRQEKALEAIGFPLPNPDQKKSKTNNRKVLFDDYMRHTFLRICAKHHIQVETEPIYGGKKYLEKMDFIIENQKKRLAEIEAKQEERLAQLEATSLRIEELDSLIAEVSEDAYQKACEVVTESVYEKTTKENLQAITDYENWLLSPERNADTYTRKYAVSRLEAVKKKILNLADSILAKVKELLMEPDAKQSNIDQIRDKARTSTLVRLEEKKRAKDDEYASRPKAKSRNRGWDDR